MINTLDDYICSSMPQWGDFTTNPNLRKKLDENGDLLPFMGNTVSGMIRFSGRREISLITCGIVDRSPGCALKATIERRENND